MSLGADKKNIISQIITELLIVGTLGFILARVTGTIFADTLGGAILDSQTASSAVQSEKNFGRPGSMGGYMSNPVGGSGSSRGNASSIPNMPDGSNTKDIMMANREDQKVELDINAKPEDYLLLFVTGYLVIILALIIPSVSIMRYQPKEILTGKE